MITPKCDKCKNELNDFGGLILSPPDALSCVKKYHICKNCWEEINKWINIDDQCNCKGCGKCCYKVVPYLDVEIMTYDNRDGILDRFIEARNGGQRNKLALWMKRRDDGSCIALDRETNLCTIYDNRPSECREFNFGHPICNKIRGESR